MPNNVDLSSGARMKVGVADSGSVMNDTNKIAFRSFEGTEQYEHFSPGDPEEGYGLFYKNSAGDQKAWDVYADPPHNITRLSPTLLRNDAVELVKSTLSQTSDRMLEIRQMFTFPVDATRLSIRMDVTNISSQDLTEVLVKRYCDIDVDTGPLPNDGWAGFQNHWAKDRDSIHAWNQPSEAPIDPKTRNHKHAHIVNMVAMPSDVPLDQTFVGQFGFDQFNQRINLQPINDSARHDAVGVLQWEVTRLRPGESIQLNLYYDAFCLCTDIPLTYRHEPKSVRATDVAAPAHVKARTRKG